METLSPSSTFPSFLALLRGAWSRYNDRFRALLAVAGVFFGCFFLLYMVAYVSLVLVLQAKIAVGTANILTIVILVVTGGLVVVVASWQQGAFFLCLDQSLSLKPSVGQSRRRLGRLVMANLLIAIVSGGPLIAVYSWAVARWSGSVAVADVPAAIFAHNSTAIPVAVSFAWSLGVWFVFLFTGPLIVLEQSSVRQAWRQSWNLFAPRWRTLLLDTILMAVVFIFPTFLLSLVPWVGPLAIALLVPAFQSSFFLQLFRSARPTSAGSDGTTTTMSDTPRLT